MPGQLWVSVVELGCFSGLLALGYFLVLRGAAVFMFALGPFAMFNAMLASFLVIEHGWPMWVAVLAGVVVSIAMSVVTEVLVVRPIHVRTGGQEDPPIVAIVAILFALQQLAGTWFGRTALPGQTFWSGDVVNTDRIVIPRQDVLLVVVTLICFGLMAVWLRRTSYGRMLRAVGDNERAASMLGVPVGRIRLVAFGVAGALAGIAGSLFAFKAGVSFTSGLSWSLAGFLAVIVGGLGSLWAPLLGGLIVAALQTFTVYYVGQAALNYAMFGLAIVFFAVRPKGIFQSRVRV
jgi:branched-chain amino acid transport system permease protein